MSIPTNNLVFDINMLLGHFKDQSDNGNDATQNADSFVKASNGWGSNPELGTLSIPDDASLDVSSTGFMFGVLIDLTKDQASGDRLLYKAGAYDIYFANSTTLAYSDGTTAYTIPGTSGYKNVQTIIFVKEAGSSRMQVYFDGAYVAQAGGNNTIGSSANTLYIGNAAGSANKMDCKFMSVVMYSEAGDATTVANLHNELIKRKTRFLQKENFATAPSVGAVESGMAENAVIVGGKTIDQGPNRYDGTPVSDIAGTQPGTLRPGLTPWGEPALYNTKGTEAHLNYGTASNTAFATSDSVFGYARWFKCSSNGSQMLISRSGNYFLQKISAGNLQLSMGSGPWVVASAVRDDVWHLYSFFVDEDYEYIYIDGEQVGKRARTGTPGAGTLREGQYVITGFDIDGGIGPRIFYKAFTDLAEYERELKTEWNRVANKVIYHQDFSDAYEHASVYAPGPLPGTDWNISSVSGQVGVESDGSKYITSPSAGNVLKRPGTDHTFGRLEYVVTPTSGTRARHSFSGSGTFAILDVGDSGNARIAYTTSTGGVVFATANGTGTTDKQTIRVDKKANVATNNTSIYKDGELLTASTGSNPFTDITNFTAERQLTSYSNAKIHSITHYFGVPLD